MVEPLLAECDRALARPFDDAWLAEVQGRSAPIDAGTATLTPWTGMTLLGPLGCRSCRQAPYGSPMRTGVEQGSGVVFAYRARTGRKRLPIPRPLCRPFSTPRETSACYNGTA